MQCVFSELSQVRKRTQHRHPPSQVASKLETPNSRAHSGHSSSDRTPASPQTPLVRKPLDVSRTITKSNPKILTSNTTQISTGNHHPTNNELTFRSQGREGRTGLSVQSDSAGIKPQLTQEPESEQNPSLDYLSYGLTTPKMVQTSHRQGSRQHPLPLRARCRANRPCRRAFSANKGNRPTSMFDQFRAITTPMRARTTHPITNTDRPVTTSDPSAVQRSAVTDPG